MKATRPAAPGRLPLWLLAGALLVATLAAYQPAWRGGLLWDDDKHVTASELRSVHGLWRIWLEPGATQQYYPVVHSAFWIEHRLWGDATLGYHVVNVALHVVSAFLLLVILRRLEVPGATLAAALFALHPIQVESVAWITELKNTLSGVFFMLSALAYLRFDTDRSRRTYAASLLLFVFALLAKSVTATLAPVLLVLAWWRRGHLDVRRDVVPALPFFAIGASAGLFTAWVERNYIGAEGSEFHLTFVERALVAGRAFWFYLGRIVWPHDLTFQYPRWTIDAGDPAQYAFPLAALALFAVCWTVRRRSRAPLAATVAYAALLFPALGFLNVYPFRYSFVADHFAYLASIPVFVIASAAVFGVARPRITTNAHPAPRAGHQAPSTQHRAPRIRFAGALVLLAVLGTLTWQQSHDYTDALTLYRSILRRNPSSWMAHSNLGALLRPSAPEEALVHLTEAVRIKPDSDVSHYNLANVLQQIGRFDDAVREYQETIRLTPGMALAHYNLGNTLLQMGRLDEARKALEDAIRMQPDLALAHSALGRVLQAMARPADAARACETAVTLAPRDAVVHYDFGGVLQAQDRLDEAIVQYEAALALRPDSVEIRNDLGSALWQSGRFEDARKQYEAAVALNPNLALVHSGLCTALQMLGRIDDARRECETAARLQPDLPVARYDLANVLQQQGQLEEAVRQYVEALRLDDGFPEVRYNLATALARLGRTADAREQESRAYRLVGSEGAAILMRAAALEGQGRLREARDDYARALRAVPDVASARQAVARIDAALRIPR